MPTVRSSTPRYQRQPGRPLLAAAATALALIALPVSAQTTGQNPGQPAAQGGGQTAPAQTGSTAPTRGNQSGIADQDREFIEDMAHAHLAEIETGKMALEKTQNPQVKQFAQRMVEDHTKGLQELRTLAQRKNVRVPEETDFAHKAIGAALRLLTGDFFDSQYIRHVGVNDHRRTLEMVREASREAKDPDLREHAGKSAPMIQNHLTMARQLHNQREANTSNQRESNTSTQREGQSGAQREGQSGTQRAPQR